VVSLPRYPIIKYNLDFGAAMGSSITAAPIKAFVDFFIKVQLAGQLVVPNKMVVPIITVSTRTNYMVLITVRWYCH